MHNEKDCYDRNICKSTQDMETMWRAYVTAKEKKILHFDLLRLQFSTWFAISNWLNGFLIRSNNKIVCRVGNARNKATYYNHNLVILNTFLPHLLYVPKMATWDDTRMTYISNWRPLISFCISTLILTLAMTIVAICKNLLVEAILDPIQWPNF